jgi:hypothetical protein
LQQLVTSRRDNKDQMIRPQGSNHDMWSLVLVSKLVTTI